MAHNPHQSLKQASLPSSSSVRKESRDKELISSVGFSPKQKEPKYKLKSLSSSSSEASSTNLPQAVYNRNRSTSRRNYIEDSDSDSEVRSTEHKFKKKGSYKLQKGSKTKNTENSKNISESFVASSESFLQNTSRSYSLRSNRSCLLSQGLPTHYKRAPKLAHPSSPQPSSSRFSDQSSYWKSSKRGKTEEEEESGIVKKKKKKAGNSGERVKDSNKGKSLMKKGDIGRKRPFDKINNVFASNTSALGNIKKEKGLEDIDQPGVSGVIRKQAKLKKGKKLVKNKTEESKKVFSKKSDKSAKKETKEESDKHKGILKKIVKKKSSSSSSSTTQDFSGAEAMSNMERERSPSQNSNEATSSLTAASSSRVSTTNNITDEALNSLGFNPGSLASIIQDADFNDVGRLNALFGYLAPRFQQLIQRTSPVYKQLLEELQCKDEGRKLEAVSDLCQLLVMGNEASLGTFPVKQAVPILASLLKNQSTSGELNSHPSTFHLMHHACRALTYMMEVLPRSVPIIAEFVPVFLEKLQSIHCLDVAEQALQALEMISRRHHKIILQADGVAACLTYIDFFSTPAQRTALSITANCFKSLNDDDFNLISDFVALITSRLNHDDNKCLEKVCQCIYHLVENFQHNQQVLRKLAGGEFLSDVIKLITLTPPRISTAISISTIRCITTILSSCPDVAVILMKMDVAETLSNLLVKKSNAPGNPLEVVSRSPQEYFEIVFLVGELMPPLPKDGIFSIDEVVQQMAGNADSREVKGVEWMWKDGFNVWRSYSFADCSIIESALQAGESEVSISIMGNNYCIDFKFMRQVNEDTGTARRVRRVAPTSNNNKVEEGVDKEDANNKNIILKDERIDLLKQDVTSTFIKTLFPAIHEVYVSSASPTIRSKCLHSLMRLVYHGEVQDLTQVLHTCNISSEIAVMLSSSEDQSIVAGMQLSFILIHKMPTVFDVSFYKEGVIHQIDKLSHKPCVASTSSFTSSLTICTTSTPATTITDATLRNNNHFQQAGRYSRHGQQQRHHNVYSSRNYFNSFLPLNINSTQTQALLPQQLLQQHPQNHFYQSPLSNLSVSTTTSSNNQDYSYSFFPTSIYQSFNHSFDTVLHFNSPFGFFNNPPPSNYRKYHANNPIAAPLSNQHHSFISASRMNRRSFMRRSSANTTSGDFVTTSVVSTASTTSSSRLVTFSDYCHLIASSRASGHKSSNMCTNNTPELLNILDNSLNNNNNSGLPAYSVAAAALNNNASSTSTEAFNVASQSLNFKKYSPHQSTHASNTHHPFNSEGSKISLRNKKNHSKRGAIPVTSSDMSTAPSATTSSRFVSFSDYCQLVASTEQENNNPSNTTTTPELLNLLDETNNNSNFPIYPTTSKEGSLSRNRWDAIKLPTFTSTTGPVPPHTSTTSNTAPSASPFRWPTPNVANHLLHHQQQHQLNMLQQQQLQHYQQQSQHLSILQQNIATTSNKKLSYSTKHNSKDENKKKIKEWIHEHATKFCKRFNHLSPSSGKRTVRRSSRTRSDGGKSDVKVMEESFKSDALSCLNQLTEASLLFQNEGSSEQALETLHYVLTHQDASTFEILHSNILISLLNYLTNNNNLVGNTSSENIKHNEGDEENKCKNKDDKFKGKGKLSKAKLSEKGKNSKSCKTKTSSTSEEGEVRDVEKDGVEDVRLKRVRLFLKVFLNFKQDKPNENPPVEAFQILVNKVLACMHHLEQFQVKVHDLPVSTSGGLSALKFFDTHHLKCNLQRHPSCTSVRNFRAGTIKIDPLALVQAIEKYLVIRGHAKVKLHSANTSSNHHEAANSASNNPQHATSPHTSAILAADEDYEDEDDLSDDDDEEDDEEIEHSLSATHHSNSKSGGLFSRHQPQQQHLLEFVINGHVVPYNITVYEAIKNYSVFSGKKSEDSENSFTLSSLWTATHNIYFRLATPTSASLSSYQQKSSKQNKKNKQSNKTKGKISEKISSEVLYKHYTNVHHQLLSALIPHMPSITDPCTHILPLLSVVYSINQHWASLFNLKTISPLIPKSDFISPKLTSKATRQLQDPLAVVTATFPEWLSQLSRVCPFLLPFNTRQHLFYTCAFDRERAIVRLQREHHDTSESHERVLPRLEKKKTTVSRADILRQTEKIFADLNDSKALLEVHFEGEVGTGLGPTLEFYTMASKEMQRHDWSIWSGDAIELPASQTDERVPEGASSKNSKDKTTKTDKSDKGWKGKQKSSLFNLPIKYTFNANGLFPSPLPLNVKPSHLNKVRSRFRLVGKLMAKSLMDSRMLDLPLSLALYRWLLCNHAPTNAQQDANTTSNSIKFPSLTSCSKKDSFEEINGINVKNENLLCIQDLISMQPTIAKFLGDLIDLIKKKEAIYNDRSLSHTEKEVKVKSLQIDGCSLDDLSITFTIPGTPSIEMLKGGKDEFLSIDNVEEYVKLSLDWLLRIGPIRQLQALKEGFESVFPLSSLYMFYPEELDTLFCGNPFERWTVEHLSHCCRVDHGYDLSSAPVQFLFQVLQSFTAEQQRLFLQFTTGSPRLPVGGLKSLNPSLTIVRKSIGTDEDADTYLPSVMTCVNYLKLPQYSSLDVTREKLLIAISEGQKSFHLS